MKLKTKDLTYRALDYAVAMAEGIEDIIIHHGWVKVPVPHITERHPRLGVGYKQYQPTRSDRIAGPIIDREMISTQVFDASGPASRRWNAYLPGEVPMGADEEINGPDRRTAAMRAWVLHKLGDEVEVPDKLMEVGDGRS